MKKTSVLPVCIITISTKACCDCLQQLRFMHIRPSYGLQRHCFFNLSIRSDISYISYVMSYQKFIVRPLLREPGP